MSKLEFKEVSILGTTYKVFYSNPTTHPVLKDASGYCDWTNHSIVIDTERDEDPNTVADFDRYVNKVVRHEVIHAFFFESGLAESFEHRNFGQEETVVDWIAKQYPKIKKVYEELGVEE